MRKKEIQVVCPICDKKHPAKWDRFLEATSFNWIGYATTIYCDASYRHIWKLYGPDYRYAMFIPVGTANWDSLADEEVPF